MQERVWSDCCTGFLSRRCMGCWESNSVVWDAFARHEKLFGGKLMEMVLGWGAALREAAASFSSSHISTTTTLFLSFFFLVCPLLMSQQQDDQTRTMLNLFQRINGTALGWDVTKQPCSWKGVTCSGSSVITKLALSGFALSNSDFLPVVCQLRSLESLDASNNRLNSIPGEFIANCGGIDGLKLLNFSRNLLVGSLPNFIGFGGLESLDLSYNMLNGNIIPIGDLVKLRSLNLSHNQFTGSIPAGLGGLEQLELSVNSLDGEIPTEIADFGNLKLIDLSDNRLTGSIPDRIGELANLEVLILSSNNLSGSIPTTISGISTLSRFAVNQNNFDGEIPDGLTRYMKNLDAGYNKLRGQIPSDLLSQPNLQTVDLSYNMLEGSIPSSISSSLLRLRLGSNSLNGVIPFANFAMLEKLAYLELDNNSLTGEIPPQLGDCQALTLLNLAQNKLNGSLPVKLGNLLNLQVMKLQHKNLNGEIPSQFSQLQKLSQLNLSLNSLNGSIPSSISNLQNLVNLNLQNNNLIGLIPASIRNMTSLIELQLGDNQLSGKIPMMPPNLQIALNLSSNLFEGTIPDTLSEQTGLEVLDLSNNKFSGEIPQAFIQLKALTRLILSNNQLSGNVPKFGSWVSVDIGGNPQLIAPEPNTSPESAKRKISVAVAIIIALAAGLLAAGVVSIIFLSISGLFNFPRVIKSSISRLFNFPRVIKSSYLTTNEIHKSNICFTKAMESVVDPLNIVLKTKFSTYYKTVMPSGRSYFIKKLNRRDETLQLDNHNKLYEELVTLGKLSHPNVMTPLAYALTRNDVYLFYEYASKGTLFNSLHKRVVNDLDWPSRYTIIVGVAKALAFLHDCSSGPIILLDFSSWKIMLKSTKEAQVGDIELCKVIDPSKRTGSLSTVASPVGYTPPEYAYTMRVTKAGNVYSFGVVLLELLTGKPPVCEGTQLAKWVLQKWEHEEEKERDHILDIDISRTFRNQMLEVLEIAVACVSVSPEARPTMQSVLGMLNQF